MQQKDTAEQQKCTPQWGKGPEPHMHSVSAGNEMRDVVWTIDTSCYAPIIPGGGTSQTEGLDHTTLES